MFEHLDIITLRIAYMTKYKAMESSPLPKVRKYMDIVSEAGQYYTKVGPYFKDAEHWNGFEKFTMLNSIKDITQFGQQFNDNLRKCSL